MNRRRAHEPPARPLVLIVDGHDDTCELYALALSAMGFEVIPTHDETDALGRAFGSLPDIIVADLPRPNLDGSQFLHDLRQNARTRSIPVVALSGHVQQSVRECAERDGFAAFFAKPCLPNELAAGLRRVLDGNGHALVER